MLNSISDQHDKSKKRICPICQSRVVGRSDKKFCSVKCKTYYHQRLRLVTKTAAAAIDKILHRNRSILLEVMGKHNMRMTIPKLELAKRKFNFQHITHYHINHKGKTYHFVYDFAWMTFSDDEVLIVRKKYN